MTTEIRRATLSDIDALMEINSSSPFGHSEAVHERKINETLLVMQGQIAVAYAMWGDMLWPDENRNARFLNTVNVHADHRRQGFASLAIEGVAWMVQKGDVLHDPARFLMSSTDVTNTPSQRLHESLGFKHIGTLPLPDQDKAEMFYTRDLQEREPASEARPVDL